MNAFSALFEGTRLRLLPSILAMIVALLLVVGDSSASAAGGVSWSVRGAAQPSEFAQEAGNWYQLVVLNTGSEPSEAGVTLTDRLPQGLKMTRYETAENSNEVKWGCAEVEASVVKCTFPEGIGPGLYAPSFAIEVSAPGEAGALLENRVSVGAGGATVPALTSEHTGVGSAPQSFGLTEFSMEANTARGEAATQAAGHPWQITTSLGFPWKAAPPNEEEKRTIQVANVKKITVELPVGLVGDPLSTEHCTQFQLAERTCPPGSQVGALAIAAAYFQGSTFHDSDPGNGATPIYNMYSDGQAPVEFGFTYAEQPVYLDVSVVHSAAGERVRFTTEVPPVIETGDVMLTLWGEPGSISGTRSSSAFITDPAVCTEKPLMARVEAESWGKQTVSAETPVFQHITGCNLLQPAFAPTLQMAPSAESAEGSSQADEPSAYTTDLKVKQTSSFEEDATPELDTATVALPPGVSISPSAAQGLQGCRAEGPEGINLGSSDIGPGGQDLGDPEASEFGAGHAGGNNSPYDDGQWHTAPGHCPQASTLGSVDVCTPLLPNRANQKGVKEEGEQACEEHTGIAPLQGHLYLAQPECGAAGQPACDSAYAEGRGGASRTGKLYGLYVEVAGDGVLLKFPGTVATNVATGQLTATFKENPQLPFGDLKLHFHGGPRAPLANPQSCGSFAGSSALSSWAEPEGGVSNAMAPFTIDWDGHGGACPATMPFGPSFTAGSVSPTAGAFSPFTLTFSRQDREQDLSGLALNMPAGIAGLISQVPLCGEPQAAQGTCPAASRIGSATVASGAGSQPLWLSGQVYLTSGYKGAPFGLSIVTPADAGPFHLGNVVVRSSIAVDPNTAALTILSDPLPQIVDGVPLRLRTVNVTVDRPGFMFNPTNCSPMAITGTLTAAQGATAQVSSHFQVTNCAALKFAPKFTASTESKDSFNNQGASLTVKLAANQGPSASAGQGVESNIRSVKVELPGALTSRLTTLQKACLAKTFESNPAACPPDSYIGHAVVHTPILPVPLEGPAIFVSHGGEAFPSLILVLQGYGVTIDLTGATFISKTGITSSTFKTVPDQPFSSFELTLPTGKFSALAAITNVCKPTKTETVKKKVSVKRKGKTIKVTKKVSKKVAAPLLMPTEMVAQNGAVLRQDTKIAVSGCPPTRKKAVRHVRKKSHQKKK